MLMIPATLPLPGVPMDWRAQTVPDIRGGAHGDRCRSWRLDHGRRRGRMQGYVRQIRTRRHGAKDHDHRPNPAACRCLLAHEPSRSVLHTWALICLCAIRSSTENRRLQAPVFHCLRSGWLRLNDVCACPHPVVRRRRSCRFPSGFPRVLFQVAGDLADHFLHGALDFVSGAFSAILVHAMSSSAGRIAVATRYRVGLVDSL